jgi:hypothetical protein
MLMNECGFMQIPRGTWREWELGTTVMKILLETF